MTHQKKFISLVVPVLNEELNISRENGRWKLKILINGRKNNDTAILLKPKHLTKNVL